MSVPALSAVTLISSMPLRLKCFPKDLGHRFVDDVRGTQLVDDFFDWRLTLFRLMTTAEVMFT